MKTKRSKYKRVFGDLFPFDPEHLVRWNWTVCPLRLNTLSAKIEHLKSYDTEKNMTLLQFWDFNYLKKLRLVSDSEKGTLSQFSVVEDWVSTCM